MTFLADLADNVGSGLRLPEVGLSELLSGGQQTTNTTAPVGVNLVNSPIGWGLGTGDAYAQALSQTNTGTTPTTSTQTGGSGLTLDQQQAAAYAQQVASQKGAEQAAYDDQIANLNSLLGLTNTQRDQGLGRLNQSLADQKTRLGEQETKTMAGYDQQGIQNSQDKQRGVEGVDNFANSSNTSLQRLLQQGNSANSSVGRDLIPYLVSKSAGARRTGVFNQAGENDRNIATARGSAQDEYGYARQDAENQANSQRETFQQNILNKQNELVGNRKTLEMQRAAANGSGYAGVQAAAAGSNAQLAGNQSALAALFGQYAPSYTQRAMNLKTPDLGKYTMDKAQIGNNQQLPSESSYYLTQLQNKKKQQDQLG